MHRRKKGSLERLNEKCKDNTRRSLWAVRFIRRGTVPTRKVMEAELL